MPARVTMEIVGGPLTGKVYAFTEYCNVVFGRAKDCTECLPWREDRSVSRHHFLLEISPPDVRVRDLGSSLGTLVNGRKVGGRLPGDAPPQGADYPCPQVSLHHGDRIQAGNYLFAVTVHVPVFCGACGREVGVAPEPDAPNRRGERCEACLLQPPVQRGRDPQVLQRAREEPPEPVACGRGERAPDHVASGRIVKPIGPVLLPLRCQACGNDLSTAEAGTSRSGDCVCEACRRKLEDLVEPLHVASIKAGLRAVCEGQGVPLLDDYHVEQKLTGVPSLGQVYLVRRKRDGQRLALKVVVSRVAVDNAARRLFLREFGALQVLKHPGIVEYGEHGVVGCVFYVALEYCAGGSVGQLLERAATGRLRLDVAHSILGQALEGLAFAHAHGILHRDIKPHNILLVGAAEPWTAKLSDFGLTRLFQMTGVGGMTMTGGASEFLRFVPREQVLDFRKVGPASDVWSLGATFYYMLTGRSPRDIRRGEDPMVAVLSRQCIPIQQHCQSILPEWQCFIGRALEDSMSERFHDGVEMLAAFRRLQPPKVVRVEL